MTKPTYELASLPAAAALVAPFSGEVLEKISIAGLFAALLWFVLGRYKELGEQVRGQNEALLAVVRENTSAMSRLADRIESYEPNKR